MQTERPYGPWSCRGCDIWDTMCAARDGHVAALRDLLDRDPNLYRAEYWYTRPIHFAVREGQLDAVRCLLDAGTDPARVGLAGDSLVTVARDRGHEDSSGSAAFAAATPLAWARRRGHHEIARWLQEAGAGE